MTPRLRSQTESRYVQSCVHLGLDISTFRLGPQPGQLAQWNRKGKACRRWEVRARIMELLFCKNIENVVKANNPPRFTAKRCKKYAVKNILFTAFLTKIRTAKPRPGKYRFMWNQWLGFKVLFYCTKNWLTGAHVIPSEQNLAVSTPA